jgi:hypothetical protein
LIDTNASVTDRWQAESLRATAFTSRIDLGLPEKCWSLITTDKASDSFVNRGAGTAQAGGHFLDEQLTLGVNAGLRRADMLLVPKAAEPSAIPRMSLGPVLAFSDPFVDAATRFLDPIDAIHRVAFALVAEIPVESRQDGYRLLQGLLATVTIDPDHSTELFYQINRPRPSNVIPGLSLNRLSRWNVIKGKMVGQNKLDAAYCACRLEIDINSSEALEAPLPKEKISALFVEMAALANEILAKGDV